MVPARNLLRRHYNSYGTAFADFLQEEKTADILLNPSTMADEEENQEVGSSSKITSKEVDDSWLQLGIGGGGSSSSAGTTSRSLELELFTDKPPTMQPSIATAARPVPIFSPQGFGFRGQWGYNWNTSASMNMGGGSSSSSTSYMALPPLPPPPPPLLTSPSVVPYYTNYPQFGGSSSSSTTMVTSELRVISPPTRRQAGVWFLLQAAKNQVREPFLPQIPKSYLRIRDGRMTVRLLMKYLVSKLEGLDHESEVEIYCRGQLLHPYMTLQHVRDSIWCLRGEAAVAFLPDSPADHVMILQYGRSR